MNTELQHLSTQLEAAKADALTFERLQAAPALVEKLTSAYETLSASVAKREAEGREAEIEQRLSRINNMTVTVRDTGALVDPGLLGRGYNCPPSAPMAQI